jgi:hypothetical protein
MPGDTHCSHWSELRGEDDSDAPDTSIEPSPTTLPARDANLQLRERPTKGILHKTPVLDHGPSRQLRDELLVEIGALKDGEDLAVWAHRRLAAKNMLTNNDALLIEDAYRTILEASNRVYLDQPADPISKSSNSELSTRVAMIQTEPGSNSSKSIDAQKVTSQSKPTRQRNKAHLTFVSSQPCLICQRTPSDAHHLKFAQPRSLGRKVSDEFTVPLCRDHHLQLHHHGNEAAWWANKAISSAGRRTKKYEIFAALRLGGLCVRAIGEIMKLAWST